MDNIKGAITGTIITLIIGGGVYTFSQEALVQNFAKETGMTQEQAESYINSIPEEELSSFSDTGSNYIATGQEILTDAYSVDCKNYEYEWETPTLSCFEGKRQETKIAKDIIALGNAFIKLDSDSSTVEDIKKTITLIEQVTVDNQLEIARFLWDESTIDEDNKTNAYNKALLKAALESD